MTKRPFTPRLGRIRQTSAAKLRRYSGRVLRKALPQLSRPASPVRQAPRSVPAFHGFSGLRSRRVIVQVHIVKGGSGSGKTAAHLKYLQRENAIREPEHTPARGPEVDRELVHVTDPETGRLDGHLFDASETGLNGEAFLARSISDRHQFRIMISPEDGQEVSSLRTTTRRFMMGMEKDLGTKLDWVAVDHYNTGHPHTHILLRGKDDQNRDLVLGRDYIARGMRRLASRELTLELGPRPDREIAAMMRREVRADRLTLLDRELLRQADKGRLVLETPVTTYDRFRRGLLSERLSHLNGIGLAKKASGKVWELSPELKPVLRRMGIRGDIIRTMQQRSSEPRERLIFDSASPDQLPVRGRIIDKGIADELRDTRFLILRTERGQDCYINMGSASDRLPTIGTDVEVSPTKSPVKPSDRVIAEIAGRHHGSYSAALHQAHDGPHSEAYLTAHKRRLEALRRKGIVTRFSDGSWQVPPRFLEQVRAMGAATPQLSVIRQRME